MALDPEDFFALHNLGLAEMEVTRLGVTDADSKRRQLEQAIGFFERALALRPDYGSAHNNLGIVLARNGRTDDAIKHYLAALRIKPDFVQAHYNLGKAFYRKGNLDMALEHFQKAVQIDPKFSQAREYLKKILMLQKRNEE